MFGQDKLKIYNLLQLGILVLLSKVICTQGQECKKIGSCECEFSSGTQSGIVSLKKLANPKGEDPKWKDVPADDGSKYSYNPCYDFIEGECNNVAVCQNTGGSQYSLGTQDSVKMTVESENVVFTYQAETEGQFRIGRVTLECKPNQKDTKFTAKGNPDYENSDTYYDFTVSGGEVCPGGYVPSSSSSTLSPGSIMCIIFFVLLFVYVVAGILYNKYRRGAEGKEVIPNVEFWSDLPFLVKIVLQDGVLFAIKPCKKSGEYEQI